MTLDDLNQQLEYGMTVYHHYLGQHVKLGKHYKSPFGHEGRDSFNLFRRHDGHICFCDHAFGDEFQGSCYDFVMKLFGVDFKESTRIIKREVLGLAHRELESGLSARPAQPRYKPLTGILPPSETVTIQGFPRAWEPGDLAFFARTGISEETLGKYHCYPLDSYLFSKGDKAFTITSKPGDPIYGYHFPLTGHWKIYRPFTPDKRYRWLSNVNARQDVFGWSTLPQRTSRLYLCAGQRDTMALHELTGLPCIALNSETAKLTPELYQLLTCIADEVYCCLDNDATGHKAQLQMRYDWGVYDAGREVLESAGVNDLSELLELYGGQNLPTEELAQYFCTFSLRKLVA